MTKIAPWEPPLASSELDHLVGALDRLRTTFRWKADGLDSAGLDQHIGDSALTLGGLLKHLAAVEDTTFRWKLAGQHPGEGIWQPETWGENDQELLSAVHDTPEQLYAAWDGAVSRSRDRLEAALAAGGLDGQVHDGDGAGNHANLRRLLFDLVEEYGRHTGHADLLREVVDGRVGEDPPLDWRPQSGSPLSWIRDWPE
ncbi:DUF664 domain-containing protein [Cellulomonas sp. URHD0024]|uniref:mycothiol transferase n=1 Tax=Cellulomonas sp. URHD0024 TaxID=1302620 RepID=UPI00040E0F86|nr:DUF664 domain-containing protein [Cellulomonas sp. URHD0024]